MVVLIKICTLVWHTPKRHPATHLICSFIVMQTVIPGHSGSPPLQVSPFRRVKTPYPQKEMLHGFDIASTTSLHSSFQAVTLSEPAATNSDFFSSGSPSALSTDEKNPCLLSDKKTPFAPVTDEKINATSNENVTRARTSRAANRIIRTRQSLKHDFSNLPKFL